MDTLGVGSEIDAAGLSITINRCIRTRCENCSGVGVLVRGWCLLCILGIAVFCWNDVT